MIWILIVLTSIIAAAVIAANSTATVIGAMIVAPSDVRVELVPARVVTFD